MTMGLAVAGVVGTGALGGLAWAQAKSDTAGSSTSGSPSTSANTGFSTPARTTTLDDNSSNSGSSGSTSTFPQLRSGSGSSHTRTAGS